MEAKQELDAVMDFLGPENMVPLAVVHLDTAVQNKDFVDRVQHIVVGSTPDTGGRSDDHKER